MKKKSGLAILLLILTSLFLSGCFALAEPEESSGVVSAPTITALEETAAESMPAEAYPGEQPTTAPAAQDAAETYPGAEAVQQPPSVEEPPANYPGVEGEIVGTSAVYNIDPARSEARFTINEVLRGADKTVVGVSNNLAGEIAFDLNNPSAAQVGTIVINARDFRTDDDFRNRAIANQILRTNEFETITFEPTSVSGLPATVAVGETYNFQVTGNLTIIGQTREETFDVQVTPISENELQGLASLEILHGDFGIVIPFARAVEAVEDNVLLELEFVAVKE